MNKLYSSLLPHWTHRPLAAIGLLLATAGAAQAQTTSFAYKGYAESYSVPPGISRLQVVAVGGSGGQSKGPDGFGARVQAIITVVPGEALTVVVGGSGTTTVVGYNGGGKGRTVNGGGATDLRRTAGSTDDYLATRRALLVAGGAGSSLPKYYGFGGNGGTPQGGDGGQGTGGGGASQSGVGAGADATSSGTNSTGGTGAFAGGGGGYYGGGGGGINSGGGTAIGGGGGGSSWVAPSSLIGSVAYSLASAAGDGSLAITPLYTPTLTSLSPSSGQVGASVTLTGTNLGGTTLITFGGTSNNTVSTGYTVNAAGTSITGIVVPSGAATGPISVTTPGGVASTSGLTPATFTVTAPTTTGLTSNLSSSTAGQLVTFTATVSSSGATPTGVVNFLEGASLVAKVALDAAGQASYQTSSLFIGNRVLSAIYVGNASFASSVGRLNFVVNPVTATTWTGTTSQDWFTASNWTAGVPDATLDALIPTGRSLYPVIGSGAAVTRALTNDGRITQSAGSLTVNGNLSNTGSLVRSAGTIATSGELTNSGTLTQSGGDITVGGSLTNSSGGTITHVGGTIAVSGNLTNNSPFTTSNTQGTGGGTVLLGGGAAASGILGSSAIRFWNLTVQAGGAQLSTSAGASVRSVLTLTGNLTTNGNVFTIESASTGDALVVNNGGVVSGNATVQRYIDPSLNPGLGYRHYAAPVSTSTVADLATPTGFTPDVRQAAAYNTSPNPTTVTPLPTVFYYDQAQVNRNNASSNFDKGFVAPLSLASPLQVGQGYTVNIGASELVDFVGQLNNGDLSLPLARNQSNTLHADEAGWQFLGNPYPAPLDYSLVAPADRPGLDAAIYVFSSTGPYAGQYRGYVNGLGGNPVLPVAQGFFTRVSADQTRGALTFRNSQRLTAPDGTTFQRPAADLRPQVQLELRGGTGPADVFYAYAEAGASPTFDSQYDAAKLLNPSGLNLASVAGADRLAIDGRAAFTAATVLPLVVGVPAAGPYSLSAAALANLPAGLTAYLHDSQTGQTRPLAVGAPYAFSVADGQAAAPIVGRFTLRFTPPAPLATAPAALAEQMGLYPNPTKDLVTIELPASLNQQPVTASLVDALGRVVRTQVLRADLASHIIRLTDLATGMYTVRLSTELGTVVKKLVIE